MSDKPKFPIARAQAVAEKIVEILAPACVRIQIAGSIRRQKPMVGDIEILYIPKLADVPDPQDLFGDKKIKANAADLVIEHLITHGQLEKRLTVRDSETWGQYIKLARAVKTGIPVDFFTATPENWWNYLVCRTGSAENNIRIATAAQKNRDAKWAPYSAGFKQTRVGTGERVIWRMTSEQDVFEFAGLRYLEPHER